MKSNKRYVFSGWMKFFVSFLFISVTSKALAVEEPYLNELKGAQVAAGGFFTVADEKFHSATADWNLINHISIDDIISFEINFDTSIYFYNTPFNCNVNFKIYIYGNRDDTSAITDSLEHADINLNIRYDTVTGKPYKGIALYKFKGIHKYKVKILSITSSELSPIPAIFRLKGQIIINRQYVFENTTTDHTLFSIVNDNQLKLEWTPSLYPGAEMFDLEYTFIDKHTQIAEAIEDHESGGNYVGVPADTLAKWFHNNSSRITTSSPGYLVNMPYDSGYILFRIRGVQIHHDDGIRWEGDWNYNATRSEDDCSGIVKIDGHEQNLNWQFSVSFAEEGKRKEVISYFDGSLRNRQSVTISNTDNKSIIQESVYDALGRPAASILPAPANDSTIHYFRGFNKNTDGDPYSFSDLLYSNCNTTAGELVDTSGTSKYYSSNNSFLSSFYYAKYIPDGAGYPLAVTEYVADNTGRIKSQGGVGTAFQIGSGHETNYFYGKPTQTELDRLFGTEAGSASHYVKNMVVDPNGQVSVSYVDASGRTIATSLAGISPENLHSLPSNNEGAVVNVSNDIIQPADFIRNASDFSTIASATFLAPVPGDYLFKYQVDPLQYQKLFGPDKDSVICSDCYYDLEVIVKNACDSIMGRDTVAAGNIFDTACNVPGPIIDSFNVEVNKIGEYYVTYTLKVSRDAMLFYDSVHLTENSDIKKLNYFLLEELKNTDFYGCYSNCETCFDKLGTQTEFYNNFQSLYITDSVPFATADSLWILDLYDSLYAHCQSIQTGCGADICDEKLQLLKMDVSPGGQYALYDSNYNLLERPINRLDTAWRNKIKWFTDELGNRDSVTLVDINGEDSITLDVKDLNDSLFIQNWKDVWADSLVRLHPEYCYYLWCLANSNSYQFDRDIENWMDADTAMAKGWFDPNDYEALLKEDPFFNSGGNGVPLYDQMKNSLKLFSRTSALLSQSDKNILEFIDVVLYCKDQSNGWNGCNPDDNCRSRSREWFLYKELYLNLKQRFYEEARRTSGNPVFAACTNCHIGNDMFGDVFECADINDFSILSGGDDPGMLYQNAGTALVNRKTFVKVQSHLSSGGGSFITTVVFQPGDNKKIIEDVEDLVLDSIIYVSCDTTSFTNFTDSTCNYFCPGGIYIPYDKDSISLYIEYGNPGTVPTGTPSGYGNCQFYAAFNLQTGADSRCLFFNVWVCAYDSTCGGICPPVTAYPSQCEASGNDTLYKNKERWYPEYVNSDEFINGVLNSNPQQESDESEEAILDQCRANCEAQADLWMNTLRRCGYNTADSIELRAALIDICSKGCSIDRVFGTSTVPSTITATYHSFEEAIEAILGPNAINDSCTAELLSMPYPYDKQPVVVDKLIMETNYEICQKVSLRKQEYQSSGFSGSFHAWLLQTYGAAYTLDSLELDDMINSCTNCNGMLRNDIVLPLIFDPQSGNCLRCDSVQVAFDDFNEKFPDIDTLSDDYNIVFTNFFNHRFGFALTFYQYKDLLDSCIAHNGSYTGIVCNQPVTTDVEGDDNACIAELFATALTNATYTYIAYIDSVRKDFQDAWMTKCMNVQPYLNMTADLYEYHYTLYYYDQSGNLVKTVPPEGVKLLTEEELADVKLYRLLQNEGCYQYSDSIKFNNNGQVAWDTVSAFEGQPYTIEMMANLSSHADQVIASKVTQTDLFGGVLELYTGFIIKVLNNKLQIELYGWNVLDKDTTIAVSNLNITSLLPINTWKHLAMERTANLNDPVRVFINGQQVAMQYAFNSIAQSTILSGNAPLMVASHGADSLDLPGGLRGTIKNLRVYNRLLPADELRQIAFNACQLPVSMPGLIFWAPMNSAKDSIVKDIMAQKNGKLTGFAWTPFNGVDPGHRLATTYQYNSLNQVMQQYSPDGDTSVFFYDRLGRLTASQNKEQKENVSYSGPAGRFSYTLYDSLGRITLVGEKYTATDVRTINMLKQDSVNYWLGLGTNKQITKTIYDNPINLYQNIGASRKRVIASIYLENESDAEGDSTLYSYDINGNVKTLVQHIKALVAVDNTNGKKQMDYDYDLVSGKVNMVSYQPGKGDQFFYKYHYDADNRVTRSYSSRDRLIWTEDASYNYYLHGPLARTELGNYKVQGVDYAYTLQGWLKGINSDSLNAAKEMGGDGYHSSIFARVSKDVYGFKLGYYSNDYIPIDVTNATALANKSYTAPPSLANTGNELFNGNISFTTLALSKINSGATAGYSYGYDQLNRLKEMRQHTTGTTSGWSNSNIITAYSESISYDANGNILKYLRKGTAAELDMDSMNYNYNRDGSGNLVNNKLNHVRDQVSGSNYAVDIDNQSANNYVYDKIGNLIKDAAENLDTVRWTVYGKINRIVKLSGDVVINYGYDPGGNRTTKKVNSNDTITNTYYVRDAQGNVMGVYSIKDEESLKWNEQHLYGSSRLGMWNWDTIVPAGPPVVDEEPIYDSLLLGSRTYELSNHLGNVLSTISDKKIGNDSSGVVNYYLAEVLSQNDYYPFGMIQPGRKYSAASSYRYGFNGKENDNEVKGEGNQQDYGMRIYDPRLGRFLSMDPISKSYPELTPYQFASNKPINSIDLDGEESKESYMFYDVTGKLTSAYTKDVDNPYDLGSGTLYHIYTIKEISSKQINEQTIEVQQTTMGNHMYVPPSKNWLQQVADWFKGKIPQIMVFGYGKDMSGNNGSEPDYDKPLYSFNFKEFNEMMELIMLGMETPDLSNAEPDKVPELTKKLFDQVAEDNPDNEEAKKLKETNGTNPVPRIDPAKPANKSHRHGDPVYCRTCKISVEWNKKGKYWQVPSGPAKDTMEGKDHNR